MNTQLAERRLTALVSHLHATRQLAAWRRWKRTYRNALDRGEPKARATQTADRALFRSI